MTETVIKKVTDIRQNLTSILSDKNFNTVRPWYDRLEEIERYIVEENMKLQLANQRIATLSSKLACEELTSQMWKTEVDNLAERHNTLKALLKARQTDEQTCVGCETKDKEDTMVKVKSESPGGEPVYMCQTCWT
jgi:phosphopantetheine adenylyltransferase